MTIMVSMRCEANQGGLHGQVEVRAHVLVDGTYLGGSDRIGGKHVPVHRHPGIEVQFLGKLEGFTHRHVADDATAVPEQVALVDRPHRGGNGPQPCEYVDHRLPEAGVAGSVNPDWKTQLKGKGVYVGVDSGGALYIP